MEADPEAEVGRGREPGICRASYKLGKITQRHQSDRKQRDIGHWPQPGTR